jgi:hypothetical protein
VSYGPDSLKSLFNPDTCAVQLGLPTCAEWVPDSHAILKFLALDLPDILGGWCLIGILGAGINASSGSLLAISAVLSHNICRQLNHLFPGVINENNLLTACRIATLPCVLLATLIAVFQAERAAYIFTVAFDLSMATVVVPLFGCFYAKNPSPRAAIVSITAGISSRIMLELVLPKDGYFVFPFPGDAFLKVGPAASALYPSFIDVDPSLHWNPEEEPCYQERFNDWTGIDSIISTTVALISFCGIQIIENRILKRALFTFPGGIGYDKTEKHTEKFDASEDSDNPAETDQESGWSGE